jgi:CrcB protein
MKYNQQKELSSGIACGPYPGKRRDSGYIAGAIATEIATMQAYLLIGLGGALGSMARHWLNGMIGGLAGVGFPWGTLVVNVSGSFLIGFAAATMNAEGRFPASEASRQFLMVGLCGGYTTFSAFSLQTLSLLQGGQWLPAAGNVGLSVMLCMAAVWLGYMAGLAVNPK